MSMEVVVSIIVAIFAFIFGFFAQSYMSYIQQRLAAIDDHIKDIQEARDAAYEYWRNPSDSEGQIARAARLKGLMFGVFDYGDRACEILGSHKEDYMSLVEAFYDKATGGDFETSAQIVDDRVISDVFKVSAQICLKLRHARRNYPPPNS